MDTLLIFFLNRSFLDVEKNKKRFFKIRESLPFLFIKERIKNVAQYPPSSGMGEYNAF